jgi:hypothetical protein
MTSEVKGHRLLYFEAITALGFTQKRAMANSPRFAN